jgi:hypothetical protein
MGAAFVEHGEAASTVGILFFLDLRSAVACEPV